MGMWVGHRLTKKAYGGEDVRKEVKWVLKQQLDCNLKLLAREEEALDTRFKNLSLRQAKVDGASRLHLSRGVYKESRGEGG